MSFVYRFISKNMECLYIGKTKELDIRMSQHFTHGHLTKEQYSHVHKVEYISLQTYADAGIMERVLIGYYKPPYNTQYTKEGDVTISVPIPCEDEWKEYELPEYDDAPIRSKWKMCTNKYALRWLKKARAVYCDGSRFRFFNESSSSDVIWEYWLEEYVKENNEKYVDEDTEEYISRYCKNNGVIWVTPGTIYSGLDFKNFEYYSLDSGKLKFGEEGIHEISLENCKSISRFMQLIINLFDNGHFDCNGKFCEAL